MQGESSSTGDGTTRNVAADSRLRSSPAIQRLSSRLGKHGNGELTDETARGVVFFYREGQFRDDGRSTTRNSGSSASRRTFRAVNLASRRASLSFDNGLSRCPNPSSFSRVRAFLYIPGTRRPSEYESRNRDGSFAHRWLRRSVVGTNVMPWRLRAPRTAVSAIRTECATRDSR